MVYVFTKILKMLIVRTDVLNLFMLVWNALSYKYMSSFSYNYLCYQKKKKTVCMKGILIFKKSLCSSYKFSGHSLTNSIGSCAVFHEKANTKVGHFL